MTKVKYRRHGCNFHPTQSSPMSFSPASSSRQFNRHFRHCMTTMHRLSDSYSQVLCSPKMDQNFWSTMSVLAPRLEDGEFLRLCLATAKAILRGFQLEVRKRTHMRRRCERLVIRTRLEKGDAMSINAGLSRLKTAGSFMPAPSWMAPRFERMAVALLPSLHEHPAHQEAITQSYDGIPSVDYDETLPYRYRCKQGKVHYESSRSTSCHLNGIRQRPRYHRIMS